MSANVNAILFVGEQPENLYLDLDTLREVPEEYLAWYTFVEYESEPSPTVYTTSYQPGAETGLEFDLVGFQIKKIGPSECLVIDDLDEEIAGASTEFKSLFGKEPKIYFLRAEY